MKIENLYSTPGRDVLDDIVRGKRLRIASPFYSAASISLLDLRKSMEVSLITRLPDQYNMPVAYIENDPAPLKGLLESYGDKVSLYALPSLHAKLFINENSVWMGSSNFTLNGFSGKQEIVAKFSEEKSFWSNIFNSYVDLSTRIAKGDLEKLDTWIQSGLTRISRMPPTEKNDDSQIAEVSFSFEEFVLWLQKKHAPLPDLRKHLFDRVKGMNFMSGHVRAGFHGTMAFLAANEQHMDTVVAAGASSVPAAVLGSFSEFVRLHGDEYRGPQGGYWRSYLSTKLGGVQTRGGAGDIIVKRCLVLVPHYIKGKR